jgi:hypothetical protein
MAATTEATVRLSRNQNRWLIRTRRRAQWPAASRLDKNVETVGSDRQTGTVLHHFSNLAASERADMQAYGEASTPRRGELEMLAVVLVGEIFDREGNRCPLVSSRQIEAPAEVGLFVMI